MLDAPLVRLIAVAALGHVVRGVGDAHSLHSWEEYEPILQLGFYVLKDAFRASFDCAVAQ